MVPLLCASELDRTEGSESTGTVDLNRLEESASPFIDEGDGLTSERERIHMLLGLVAHVGGYRMMVGAHNTVECQMHVGGGVVFFGYGRRRRLPHCRYLEACKGFYHVCPVR